MKRALFVLAGLAATALALAQPTHAAGHAVEMRNNAYNPPDLTVAVGDTVVWHNFDAESHSVVGGAINSPDIAPGGEFSWTFSGPAEISYTCRFHPYMTGVVRATSGGAPTASPSASPSPAPTSAAPATTTPAASASTAPPPAARMALASETPLRPELVSDPTTTVETAPPTTAPTVETTIAEAAIESASSSSSLPLGWLLLIGVVVAGASFLAIRALRQDVTR